MQQRRGALLESPGSALHAAEKSQPGGPPVITPDSVLAAATSPNGAAEDELSPEPEPSVEGTDGL